MKKLILERYLIQNHSEQTAISYQYRIENYLRLNPKAKDYDFQQVTEYIASLKQHYPDAGSRNTILSAIKRYYDYLIHVRYRDDHPAVNIYIKARRNRDIQTQNLFSPEDLELLLTREERYKNLTNRNKVIISLLIYQGLTPQEIVRMRLSDIDLDAGTIYVKSSLNNNSRTLEMHRTQFQLFDKYNTYTRPELAQIQSDYLVIGNRGDKYSVDALNRMLRPMKVLYDKNINAKIIRQSVIYNWLNKSKYPLEDVQQMAGHKWPSSTEKYLDEDSEQWRKLINEHHPMNSF